VDQQLTGDPCTAPLMAADKAYFHNRFASTLLTMFENFFLYKKAPSHVPLFETKHPVTSSSYTQINPQLQTATTASSFSTSQQHTKSDRKN
jgi:hypothetical protein